MTQQLCPVWKAAVLAGLVFSALQLLPAPSMAQRPMPPAAPVERVPLPPREAIVPVIACADLKRVDFGQLAEAPTRIASAEVIPASQGAQELCRVRGYVAPQVQFQLDLPTTTYAGRYLQTGCGGNCGMLAIRLTPQCDDAVARSGSFALGATDSGHAGSGFDDAVWAAGGDDLRRDFAYRADHVTALAARQILKSFYGKAPEFSYFMGCSDGGREALEEAQRYPTDFNGIVAGSPALYIAEAMEHFLWEAKYMTTATGGPMFDARSAGLLHAAVMKSCDALDGVEDGEIDEPRACHFDPGTLLCPAAAGADCLTREQVESARALYQGPVDAQGQHLYQGGEPYGAELPWAGQSSGQARLADGFIRYMILGGNVPRDFDLAHWKFDAKSFAMLAKGGLEYDSSQADLRPFRDAGGKLMLWQGLSDPAMGVYGLPDYYQSVRNKVGGMQQTRQFARMFLIPGVYHCGAGYVPYEEDLLGSMVAWVENKKAPDSVIASAFLPGGVVRQRPVYAYPVRAKYMGHGDVNQSQNFTAETPAAEPHDSYIWLGSSK